MPMYKLIEYSHNHSKIFGVLQQYCSDIPVLDANDNIADFNADNATTDSFERKEK